MTSGPKGHEYPYVLSFLWKHVGKERTERRNCVLEIHSWGVKTAEQTATVCGGSCGVCLLLIRHLFPEFGSKWADNRTESRGREDYSGRPPKKTGTACAFGTRTFSSIGNVVRLVLWQAGRQGCPGWTFSDRRSGLQSDQRQLWLR